MLSAARRVVPLNFQDGIFKKRSVTLMLNSLQLINPTKRIFQPTRKLVSAKISWNGDQSGRRCIDRARVIRAADRACHLNSEDHRPEVDRSRVRGVSCIQACGNQGENKPKAARARSMRPPRPPCPRRGEKKNALFAGCFVFQLVPTDLPT